MGKKLTKEQQEHLIEHMKGAMAMDMLRSEDALAILEVLLEACRREKDEIDPMGFISEFLE